MQLGNCSLLGVPRVEIVKGILYSVAMTMAIMGATVLVGAIFWSLI